MNTTDILLWGRDWFLLIRWENIERQEFVHWSWTTLKLEYGTNTETPKKEKEKTQHRSGGLEKLPWLHWFFPAKQSLGTGVFSLSPFPFSLQVFSWVVYVFGTRASKGYLESVQFLVLCVWQGTNQKLANSDHNLPDIPLPLKRSSGLCSQLPTPYQNTHSIETKQFHGNCGSLLILGQ